MGNTIRLHNGNCVEVLGNMPENSVGAFVCDPPYGLRFMGKAFDDLGDGGAQREWHKAWVEQAFRVLKPGGVMKAFCGSRTFHHLGAVMKAAGFEGVGLEAWAYGSGFPKSMNIGKMLDKQAGAEREVVGLSPHDANRITGSIRTALNAANDGSLQDAAPRMVTAAATDAAKVWDGWGTALKPAWEPALVGRKPL